MTGVQTCALPISLTNDPAKQEAIYTQATKQFPNDYRAFNNLGKLAYQAGNVDKAESYFKKAASVNASPEVNMNLGLISLIKGDKAAAETYFGKAAGTKELGESMGNLYIAQGQYERAVNSFRLWKCVTTKTKAIRLRNMAICL